MCHVHEKLKHRLAQQRDYNWFHIRKHQLHEDIKFYRYEPRPSNPKTQARINHPQKTNMHLCICFPFVCVIIVPICIILYCSLCTLMCQYLYYYFFLKIAMLLSYFLLFINNGV